MYLERNDFVLVDEQIEKVIGGSHKYSNVIVNKLDKLQELNRRTRWRNIILGTLGAAVLLSGALLAGYSGYSHWQNRINRENREIKLDANIDTDYLQIDIRNRETVSGADITTIYLCSSYLCSSIGSHCRYCVDIKQQKVITRESENLTLGQQREILRMVNSKAAKYVANVRSFNLLHPNNQLKIEEEIVLDETSYKVFNINVFANGKGKGTVIWPPQQPQTV